MPSAVAPLAQRMTSPPSTDMPHFVRPQGARLVLALFALALGGFGIGTTEFATMGVLPEISDDLRTSIPSTGHLISLYALGVVVGAPLLAVLGARLPRKQLLLGLMLAFTVANLASALAPSFGLLAVGRFLSGLPHGAYFGIGSVVAARLVAPERRGRAVATMMAGLTTANLAGVPLSTVLGQAYGWRATYVVVTVLGALTLLALALWLPHVPGDPAVGMRSELNGLRERQVWLTVLTGAIGFGGFFAVYSYIAPTLTDVSGYAAGSISFILALFGLGMTLGNVLGGRLADWSVDKTLRLGLGSLVVVLLAFTVLVHGRATAAIGVFLLGGSGSAMIPALQARLMDVSGSAQALGAALNHSALNVANALGAWLGGLVIAAGFGYPSTAVVGAALAAAGLLVVLIGRRLPSGRERAHPAEAARQLVSAGTG
ncbi:MAG: transporter, family, inner rane transport protein [Frankiaceae bacterium]|nr:transporter, family, inner rane transport protein [Frankiaceae bacterium]